MEGEEKRLGYATECCWNLVVAGLFLIHRSYTTYLILVSRNYVAGSGYGLTAEWVKTVASWATPCCK